MRADVAPVGWLAAPGQQKSQASQRTESACVCSALTPSVRTAPRAAESADSREAGSARHTTGRGSAAGARRQPRSTQPRCSELSPRAQELSPAGRCRAWGAEGPGTSAPAGTRPDGRRPCPRQPGQGEPAPGLS